MDEKRRFKRLDLDVKIETSRIDEGPATTVRYLDVKVTDISREGLGFISPEKMERAHHLDQRSPPLDFQNCAREGDGRRLVLRGHLRRHERIGRPQNPDLRDDRGAGQEIE